MSRKSLAISMLAAGFAVGQLNPLGWLALRAAEFRIPQMKTESLASPSPFDNVPRAWWVAESANAFAYENCAPLASTHILVVPKRRYETLLETPRDVLSEMLELVKASARDAGIAESGFRVVINTNPHGTQAVYHTHMHVVGGEQLPWPMLRHAWSSVFNTCEEIFDS